MDPSPPDAPLERKLTLFPATALNMANMIGVGPFITIPALMSCLGGGPQALLGWAVALIITIPDALVWSELGAAMPKSGGTYGWLREAFGPRSRGQLMAFLFLWQFLISGPLEIGSAYIGAVNYLSYVWPDLTGPNGITTAGKWVVVGLGLLNVILLYRRIASIAKLTLILWVGVMITILTVLVSGALHFNPARAFDFPSNAFGFSFGFLLGLAPAARIGIYDFLGYYDVCYLGDEVANPGRVIPRAVIASLLVVAMIYVGINLAFIGVISWREFTPANDHPEIANFLGSVFIERLWGPNAAKIFTWLVVWTALGSAFALLLGYSRIPFAAALDGAFFSVFGKVHPRGHFPHVSLLALGGLAIVAAMFPLTVVIDILVIARILLQFVAQIVALVLLRVHRPDLPRPYRVWLYPIPILTAGLGWLALFAMSEPRLLSFAGGAMALGMVSYLLWAGTAGKWPFQRQAAPR